MFHKNQITHAWIPGILFIIIFVSISAGQDSFDNLRKRFGNLRLLDEKPSGEEQMEREREREENPATTEEEEIEELPGMVYVPAGDFTMGTNIGFDYEFPEHKVFLEGFHIDKYEVSNMQYKRFIDYTGHPAPHNWKKGSFPGGKGFFPVTDIFYTDAAAYAKWAGKRLPTEAEWEKAARGTDGYNYPWGNQWKKGFANIRPTMGFGSMKPIGSYPEGISKYGAYDMCGNVWEWTSSDFEAYKGNSEPNDNFGKGNKVIRGGSYRQSEVMGQSIRRDFMDPEKRRSDVGFRCVR